MSPLPELTASLKHRALRMATTCMAIKGSNHAPLDSVQFRARCPDSVDRRGSGELQPGNGCYKTPRRVRFAGFASLIKNLPAPDLAASKKVFVRVITTATPRAVLQDTLVAKTEGGKVLVQKVLASLKPNAKSLGSAFRLRVLLGEAPALAVVPDLVCPPK